MPARRFRDWVAKGYVRTGSVGGHRVVTLAEIARLKEMKGARRRD